MTNEEIERTMRFILEQQARTDTKLEILTERVGALTVNVDALAISHDRDRERLKRVEDSFQILVALAQRHEERPDELSQAQTRMAEQLTSLAGTVERYINEGRNGQN